MFECLRVSETRTHIARVSPLPVCTLQPVPPPQSRPLDWRSFDFVTRHADPPPLHSAQDDPWLCVELNSTRPVLLALTGVGTTQREPLANLTCSHSNFWIREI